VSGIPLILPSPIPRDHLRATPLRQLEMASLSLREAARRAGISRSTLHRAVQRGQISVTRTEAKAILVDPAELARVFPPRPAPEPSQGQAQGQVKDHPKGHDGVALARAEARLEALTQVVEDLRRDRDRWAGIAEQSQRLLMAPKPVAPWWWPFRSP